MTSYDYIIVDSCIISFNLNCIMQSKQFYNIATKVSSRKVLLLLVIYLTAEGIPNSMMTSSIGNIFRVTGHLCGEFTGVNSPHKGQWRGALMFSLIFVWINGWVNNREASDLRRYRCPLWRHSNSQLDLVPEHHAGCLLRIAQSRYILITKCSKS